MDTRTAPITELKADTATAGPGSFTALVSAFGVVDAYGDRVMPGAFGKSLARWAERGRPIPVVFSHQHADAKAYVGKVTAARETDDGLEVEADFLANPEAQHVRELLAEGLVSEFSFAYEVKAKGKGDDGVRELTEVDLIEVGPTLRGANPATALLGVKAAGAKAGLTLNEADAVQLRSVGTALRRAAAVLDRVVGAADPADDDTPPDDDSGKAAALTPEAALAKAFDLHPDYTPVRTP